MVFSLMKISEILRPVDHSTHFVHWQTHSHTHQQTDIIICNCIGRIMNSKQKTDDQQNLPNWPQLISFRDPLVGTVVGVAKLLSIVELRNMQVLTVR